jgi:hypothetical protein
MADPVWTDGVTPLNSLNMTKLQTRDEKAAVNGYPSLDTGGKVPAAQLPDLSAAYQAKSEKAVANGYAGLDSSAKVPLAQLWTDTTNALLTLDASGRVRTAQLRTTYSTTPPSSPVDGDLWVLPADATNGVMWTFRYRPASPHAYKWEFVGGLALRSEDNVAAGPIGNSFVALGTPTIVNGGTGGATWNARSMILLPQRVI